MARLDQKQIIPATLQQAKASTMLPQTDIEREMPAGLFYLRRQIQLVEGDLQRIMEELKMDPVDAAAMILFIAKHDADSPDIDKISDSEICRRFHMLNPLILEGIRNNVEYQSIWTKIARGRLVRDHYPKILASMTREAEKKGNVKAAEFILTHVGMHQPKQNQRNTQINVYGNKWKERIKNITGDETINTDPPMATEE